jgi:hypothetical protein
MRMLPILLLSAPAMLLHGQAIIEYGASAGRAGPAAAAIGKSVTKTIGSLNNTLATAAGGDARPVTSQAPAVQTPASAIPAATPPESAPIVPAAPIDFAEIVTGMEKAELLKKAGKPAMSLTSTESSTLVETYWYRSGEDRVTVVLRNGKVATISGAEKLAAK